MINDERVENRRKPALEWWRGLSRNDQWGYIITNEEFLLSSERRPEDLTGREIETIYNNTIKG